MSAVPNNEVGAYVALFILDYLLDPGLEFLFFEFVRSTNSASAGSILLNLLVALRDAFMSLSLLNKLKNLFPSWDY